MHLAFLLDGTPAWKEEAGLRLGCDPCEVYRAEDGAEFLFGRDSPMTLEAGDVESAVVLPTRRNGRRVYLLLLTLSDSGVERVESYSARYPRRMTVNEHAGALLGVQPLVLNGDQFVAGRIQRESQAIQTAESLGVPFRVEDPVPGSGETRPEI